MFSVWLLLVGNLLFLDNNDLTVGSVASNNGVVSSGTISIATLSGDLEVSHNDKYLAYSLDTKGSEYYTIFIRDIISNKIVTKEISNTV